MNPKFIIAIEKYYNIKVQKCVLGPHQFVSENYILDDSRGNQYFCKLTDKLLFIPGIIQSLPVVEEMHAKGINHICYPIRSSEGLSFFIDNTLIVLFNYIPVSQGFDYDMYELGKSIAKIHAITPEITVVPKAPKENFEFPNCELFEERFEGVLTSKSIDPVIQEFKKLLQTHEKEVHCYKERLLCLAKFCKQELYNLVITHGDVATNVLVRSPNDIYIIDWDELRLAPAERDLWMIDEHPEFIQGYKNILPGFIINQNMRGFCILQYYFERMMHYFSEIMDNSIDSNVRFELVQKLARGRMAGWILSKVEEVAF